MWHFFLPISGSLLHFDFAYIYLWLAGKEKGLMVDLIDEPRMLTPSRRLIFLEISLPGYWYSLISIFILINVDILYEISVKKCFNILFSHGCCSILFLSESTFVVYKINFNQHLVVGIYQLAIDISQLRFDIYQIATGIKQLKWIFTI